MTVVITDAYLECSVYNALESVVVNVHPYDGICIVIETSFWRIEKTYDIRDNNNVTFLYETLFDETYDRSMPLLRSSNLVMYGLL
jgi:hypothetical protein